jgi:RND superfamily putative drug exporter
MVRRRRPLWRPLAKAGLQAELSRNIVRTGDQAEGKEGIGIIVAIVVLLVAFGSVIAAGIPIGTAIFGIFIGLSLIGIMAGLTEVPSISPLLATMIGLGVGIDYALFIVTRHRRSSTKAGRSSSRPGSPTPRPAAR